jgi:type VI secretion system protein ImpI
MRSEFIVRIRVTAPLPGGHGGSGSDDTGTTEYRFARLPISIGRSQDNDLEIASQFVSGRHARIEEVGGVVCVRDLGSRNGIDLLDGAESVRIPAHTAYPVRGNRFELQLGSETCLQVELGSRSAVDPQRHEPVAISPPASAPFELSGLSDGLPLLPGPRRALPELPPLEASSRAGQLASGALSLPLVPQREADREPASRRPVSSRMPPAAGGFEPVRPDQHLRGAGQPRRQAPELKTGSFDLGPEALALQGLRELIASLCPGSTLETEGDVARLIKRLHGVIEIVCRSYLALRDGHAKFVSSLHLARSHDPDPARLALDGAREPGAVAALLLDFREHATEPGPALETALKELSLHQVALLEGLMQGVRALLDELAPESIQHDLERRRSAPRLGRSEPALWDEYCERHARFAREGEALARVFGQEFAQAYRGYQRSRRSG